MKRDIYTGKSVGADTVAGLVRATRTLADISDNPEFDVVRFLECDVQKIMPGFCLFIESDDNMDGAKAFVTEESDAIVVSESVYNDACAGYFYARKILAHEFGHVLIHHTSITRKHFSYEAYEKDRKYMRSNSGSEWQAETFALILLVPFEEVYRGALRKSFVSANRVSSRMAEYVQSRVASIKRSYVSAQAEAAKEIIESLRCHWAHMVQRRDSAKTAQACVKNQMKLNSLTCRTAEEVRPQRSLQPEYQLSFWQ